MSTPYRIRAIKSHIIFVGYWMVRIVIRTFGEPVNVTLSSYTKVSRVTFSPDTNWIRRMMTSEWSPLHSNTHRRRNASWVASASATSSRWLPTGAFTPPTWRNSTSLLANSSRLSPTPCTPPTRLNSTVELRRRCALDFSRQSLHIWAVWGLGVILRWNAAVVSDVWTC